MTTQKLPGGITQHNPTDHAGEPTGLSYTGQITTVNGDGTTTVDPNGGWLSWSIDNDITGRVAREWTPDGAAFTGNAGNAPGDAIPYDRAYNYDNAGRLVTVKDRTATATGVDISDPVAAPCVTRTYGFDRNDNRLTKTSATSGPDGACTTAGATAVTRTFDSADRPITGADGIGTYTYDTLGRTTTLPASDAPRPADGAVALAYYDNDLARSISRADTTTTFAVDALDRRATETVTSAAESSQTARHYTDSSDNPTWVTQGNMSHRYAELIGSNLSLTVDQAGGADLTLANSHGDVVTTVDLPGGTTMATSIGGWNNYDEYGDVANTIADTGIVHYGWLGREQRATSDSGLLLMGVRLYNPQTGIFTSTDPVFGGNTNAYTYPTDPVNQFDLDGRINRGDMGGRSRGADYGGRGQDQVPSSRRTSGKEGRKYKFKFSRLWKKAKKKSSKSDKDRNSGENHANTREEAEARAKAHARAGGRCRFRGLCSSADHYHVDYYNKRGELFHTRHYPWRKMKW